ncbi:MAG: hypothetical protein A2951_00820 [Candidatus Buchananbacteria bacterium RIFCSPLOWO2_01_FULL_56_15]|uniref:CARDB domain-containing protein n=2 Tax=Candidatus Buchananiibacteriota TaxID=1817903 RepID=A0A1G1YBW9_9BACT|nr:MAG: hypothetical protein A3J59_01715 [Candidatus Buchananbacteria bacterium RIFCSPHIGHO2_02_FULL_56_16]OGY55372.1 MAG: hypothetical protein A2951_00820 [Candidatus Buchananbacteria bacterium RIFCSPLOWO2_01_FULL_56_15]
MRITNSDLLTITFMVSVLIGICNNEHRSNLYNESARWAEPLPAPIAPIAKIEPFTPDPTMQYGIAVELDPNGKISETDESNNRQVVVLDTKGPKP